MDKEDVAHIYNGMLLSHKKKHSIVYMWHIYTMECYSAIKRNETELFVVRSMDLESVIQSEVSQKEKNKYCMLTYIWNIKKKMVLMKLGAGQE